MTSSRVDCWELVWRMQNSSPLNGLLINNAGELGKPWCLNMQYGAGAVGPAGSAPLRDGRCLALRLSGYNNIQWLQR